MIDDLGGWNITVRAVVITRFEGQESAQRFRNRLERRGVRVYTHRFTKGYPTDVDTIVSDEGYGANEYIPTDKQIVVVTGPGPNSGKLATCLSQLYHEHQRGVPAGYAKFETFPIWNLPLAHPVNVAYEAATADIGDFNAIDSFHLEATNERTINYNRDLEVFPVLRRIMERISGKTSAYRSPTEMGVNRAGFGIVDDAVVREAAVQEVIRRYFRYSCEHAMGVEERKTVQRVELLMKDLEVSPGDRGVVTAAAGAAREAQARGKGSEGVCCGAALELKDGTIVTGKNSPLMHAASSLVLNAVKHLAGIPDTHPPAVPGHHDHLEPFQEGHPRKSGGEPGPGGDPDRALHQRGHEPDGAGSGGEAGRTAGLRDAHHPHSDAGRRGGLAEAGSQPDLRPELRQQGPVRGLTGAQDETLDLLRLLLRHVEPPEQAQHLHGVVANRFEDLSPAEQQVEHRVQEGEDRLLRGAGWIDA